MVNIEELISCITESTAESIRDWDINKSIEEIRAETNSRITDIMEG